MSERRRRPEPLQGLSSVKHRHRSKAGDHKEEIDFYSTQQSAAVAMTARNKGLESLGMTGEIRNDPLTTSRKKSRNLESQGDDMFKKISQESRFTFNHPELQTSPRLIAEQQPEV